MLFGTTAKQWQHVAVGVNPRKRPRKTRQAPNGATAGLEKEVLSPHSGPVGLVKSYPMLTHGATCCRHYRGSIAGAERGGEKVVSEPFCGDLPDKMEPFTASINLAGSHNTTEESDTHAAM